MQTLGIQASLIRKVLIERAQAVVEIFQDDQAANERYQSQLSKKLDKNLHGHERFYLK